MIDRPAEPGSIGALVPSDALRCAASRVVEDYRLEVGSASRDVAIEGLFTIRRAPSGMAIHATDAIAARALTSHFTAPPGLTVCVWWRGAETVSFDGAPSAYNVQALGAEPVVELRVFQRPVDVVRRSGRGDRLRKVSVSLASDWLDAWRAARLDTGPRLSALLSAHRATARWSAPASMLAGAELILSMAARNDLSAHLAAERAGFQLIEEALNHVQATGCSVRAPASPPAKAVAVRRFLDRTLDQDLTLSRIAAEVGMSVSAMQRMFKEAFGETIVEHRRNMRLEAARRALARGGATVAEASRLARYSSASNFSIAFTRRFGVAPSKLRGGAATLEVARPIDEA